MRPTYFQFQARYPFRSNAISSLILILGDQLSPAMTSLQAGDRQTDRILMVEVLEEATYVKHHKKKIAFIFSAMR
ncbi:MAG: cryptochrome/photolyase family protein, partial [Pseudomonadota bacterium]